MKPKEFPTVVTPAPFEVSPELFKPQPPTPDGTCVHIIRTLRPFNKDAQKRILRAACILLEIPVQFP